MLNKKLSTLLLAGLLCFWQTSCTSRMPNEVEIVIISTNDIHGHFTNLAKLSQFVKETKATYKNVIVVDAGDRFTGNPYNDHYIKNQFPIVDMLNHVGLDVMVVGNHEFDFGVDLLNERIKDAKGVHVIANIDMKSSGLKKVKPYHTIKREGVRVTFLGLCNVDQYTGIPAVLASRVQGITFLDPVKTAMRYRHLREKSNVFVALTHIGIHEDRLLADSMPELDLIVSGHSHTLLEEPEIRNGVTITQGGRYARQVGKTIIRLNKGVVSSVTNEIIDLTQWTGGEDPALLAKIEYYTNNPMFNEAFVTLQYGIPNHEKLGHMMTDAAVKQLKADFSADFSLINFSAIRIENLLAGEVTYGDIFRLSPFGNRLLVIELTPAEIRNFLEQRDCELIPAGFTFETHKTSDGTNIIKKMMLPSGEELDETKTYNLAIDNFLYSRYMRQYADRATETGLFVVDVIAAYLRENPDMDYRNGGSRVSASAN